MCVIIVKTKQAKAPALEEIRDAMTVNPDGAAIAWADGKGNLVVYKTLSSKEMLKYYKEHDWRGIAFVFHARIGTHGKTSIDNCHGFDVLGGRAAFFHNGILNIDARDGMTDSETFLRDVWEPAYKVSPTLADNICKMVTKSSKFAFIEPCGRIKIYGTFDKSEGIFRSNRNHMYKATPNFHNWWHENIDKNYRFDF